MATFEWKYEIFAGAIEIIIVALMYRYTQSEILFWAMLILGLFMLIYPYLHFRVNHSKNNNKLFVVDALLLIAVLLIFYVNLTQPILRPVKDSSDKSSDVSGLIKQGSNDEYGDPGMSLHLLVRIGNLPIARRKYLCDFGHLDKSRLSIYVSSDNIFTMNFLDALGEPHILQVPIGNNGIPVGEFAYLVCEIGVSGTSTILKLYVNGKCAKYINLPFKVNVGELDVAGGVIGADLSGNNGAEFDLAELRVYSQTLSPLVIEKIKQHHDDKPMNSFVVFSGNQWMRASKAANHELK